MKKVLISMLAVALVATAADATLIGLRWKDTAAQSNTVPFGTPAVIQVYVQQMAGDPTTSGIGGHINAWDNAAATLATTPGQVSQTAVTPVPAGWAIAVAATVNGPVNAPTTQFGVSDPNPSTAGLGGTYVMAELTVQHTALTTKDIYITLDWPSMTVLGAQGGIIYGDLSSGGKWNQAKANVKSGYVAYGNWGSPGWSISAARNQAANGLILHTPEPASLALLVLGGIAALRRR